MSDDSPEMTGDRRNSPGAGSSASYRLENGLEWGLLLSRKMVLLPVCVLVVAAAGTFVYGAAVFIDTAVGAVRHPFPVGNRIGLLMLVIDLFLVGATMLIAAVGLYELFISKVDPGSGEHGMPAWLEMHDLNDLKARVISMIILVVAVAFVEVVVDFTDGRQVLYLGAGVALVVGSLTAYLNIESRGRSGGGVS